MYYLISTWINVWVNNRDAGDLRRHLAHYDVTVMTFSIISCIFYLPLADPEPCIMFEIEHSTRGDGNNTRAISFIFVYFVLKKTHITIVYTRFICALHVPAYSQQSHSMTPQATELQKVRHSFNICFFFCRLPNPSSKSKLSQCSSFISSPFTYIGVWVNHRSSLVLLDFARPHRPIESGF